MVLPERRSRVRCQKFLPYDTRQLDRRYTKTRNSRTIKFENENLERTQSRFFSLRLPQLPVLHKRKKKQYNHAGPPHTIMQQVPSFKFESGTFSCNVAERTKPSLQNINPDRTHA